MLNDIDRILLERIEIPQRSTVVNAFLVAVRAGHATEDAVADATLATLRGHIGPWGREDRQAAALVAAVLHHRQEALGLARWALAWEALPREERERLKAARGVEHRRAYLDQEPPTVKQRSFLRTLGYTGEVRSKRHASELIDQLLRMRRVS